MFQKQHGNIARQAELLLGPQHSSSHGCITRQRNGVSKDTHYIRDCYYNIPATASGLMPYALCLCGDYRGADVPGCAILVKIGDPERSLLGSLAGMMLTLEKLDSRGEATEGAP